MRCLPKRKYSARKEVKEVEEVDQGSEANGYK